jgi:hypothetical protein
MKLDDCGTAATLAKWWREQKELLAKVRAGASEVRMNFSGCETIHSDQSSFVCQAAGVAFQIIEKNIEDLEAKLRVLGVEIPPEREAGPPLFVISPDRNCPDIENIPSPSSRYDMLS